MLKILLMLICALSSPAIAAPNFVVIMTDDQTASSLTQTGQANNKGTSATFANIVRHGVLFLNSYVDVAQCAPSRVSFLTGQYSHNSGVWSNNASPHGYNDWTGEGNTLATWLQSAGYQTAMIGKYINNYPGTHPPTYVPPGWSNFQAFEVPDYYNYTINNNGALETHGNTDADYSTDVLAAKAAAFIAAQSASKPFFLWLTLNAPHDPFTPPTRYMSAFAGVTSERVPGYNESDVSDKPAWIRGLPLLGTAGSNVAGWIDQTYRGQLGTLQAVDDAVSTIFSALQSSGVEGNTYVIFTSDNGYMAGQHRIPYNKTVGYEPSAKVPLAVVGPGVMAEQTRADLVLNIDLTATIVALAGVNPGVTLDGESLVPLLTQPSTPALRSYMMTEMLIDFPQPYPVTTESSYTIPAFTMLRTPSFKYMINDVSEEELYDVARDPYELSSTAGDPNMASVLSGFRQALILMKNCSGSNCMMP